MAWAAAPGPRTLRYLPMPYTVGMTVSRQGKGPVEPFKAVTRQTMADTVYDQLRAAILAGNIPDGEELNQVALAQQFNVSRVPVREALNRLQAERLITATPYHRYIVNAVSLGSLLELVDIRTELEVFAVRGLAASATDELVDQLTKLNNDLRRQKDPAAWLEGDVELHRMLNGRGTEVAGLVLDLRGRIHRYVAQASRARTRQRQACGEHDRIIAALAAHDPDAAEVAMREHIRHTRDALAARLGPGEAEAEDVVRGVDSG